MLFVLPDHLIRIQKDFSGSPEMDAMLHEVDPVLFLIPFKGSFRQIYIKCSNIRASFLFHYTQMRHDLQYNLYLRHIRRTKQ